MSPRKKAVVLLSGGLDSATVLAIAREQGFACHALSFRYGQRHAYELEAAARVAQSLDAIEHRTAHIDLRVFGGSALTSEIEVPKHDAVDEMGDDRIRIVFVERAVPNRIRIDHRVRPVEARTETRARRRERSCRPAGDKSLLHAREQLDVAASSASRFPARDRVRAHEEVAHSAKS